MSPPRAAHAPVVRVNRKCTARSRSTLRNGGQRGRAAGWREARGLRGVGMDRRYTLRASSRIGEGRERMGGRRVQRWEGVVGGVEREEWQARLPRSAAWSAADERVTGGEVGGQEAAVPWSWNGEACQADEGSGLGVGGCERVLLLNVATGRMAGSEEAWGASTAAGAGGLSGNVTLEPTACGLRCDEDGVDDALALGLPCPEEVDMAGSGWAMPTLGGGRICVHRVQRGQVGQRDADARGAGDGDGAVITPARPPLPSAQSRAPPFAMGPSLSPGSVFCFGGSWLRPPSALSSTVNGDRVLASQNDDGRQPISSAGARASPHAPRGSCRRAAAACSKRTALDKASRARVAAAATSGAAPAGDSSRDPRSPPRAPSYACPFAWEWRRPAAFGTASMRCGPSKRVDAPQPSGRPQPAPGKYALHAESRQRSQVNVEGDPAAPLSPSVPASGSSGQGAPGCPSTEEMPTYLESSIYCYDETTEGARPLIPPSTDVSPTVCDATRPRSGRGVGPEPPQPLGDSATDAGAGPSVRFAPSSAAPTTDAIAFPARKRRLLHSRPGAAGHSSDLPVASICESVKRRVAALYRPTAVVAVSAYQA